MSKILFWAYQHTLHCWDLFIKLFECYFSNTILAVKKNHFPSVKIVTCTTAWERIFIPETWKRNLANFPVCKMSCHPLMYLTFFFLILRTTSTNKWEKKALVLTALSPWLNPSVALVFFRDTCKPLIYALRNISTLELVMLKGELENPTWGQNTFLTCCQVLPDIGHY